MLRMACALVMLGLWWRPLFWIRPTHSSVVVCCPQSAEEQATGFRAAEAPMVGRAHTPSSCWSAHPQCQPCRQGKLSFTTFHSSTLCPAASTAFHLGRDVGDQQCSHHSQNHALTKELCYSLLYNACHKRNCLLWLPSE